jgi:hypothetical protein
MGVSVNCSKLNVCISCLIANIYRTYVEMYRLTKCIEKTLNNLANSIRGCIAHDNTQY